MPLIGLGEVTVAGKRVPSAQALKKFGWKPLELGPKEGLALLNGTQFMNAYASLLTLKATRLAHFADVMVRFRWMRSMAVSNPSMPVCMPCVRTPDKPWWRAACAICSRAAD